MVSIYIYPLKHQKTRGFQMFSGGILKETHGSDKPGEPGKPGYMINQGSHSPGKSWKVLEFE